MSKVQAKSQCPSQAIGVWSWSWHQLDSGERSFGVIRYLWQAIVWTKRPSRLQVGLGESPWYVGTASGPGAPSLLPRVNKEHTWCLWLLSRFQLISKHLLHITTTPQHMIENWVYFVSTNCIFRASETYCWRNSWDLWRHWHCGENEQCGIEQPSPNPPSIEHSPTPGHK